MSSNSYNTLAFLTQPITGLAPGVTYTFSYMYQFEQQNVPSSIQCTLGTMGSESITNTDPTNTWLVGPSWYGSTFVADATEGTLSYGFFSSAPVTWWVDDFYIGC
jgi:hypothetical protein